MVLSNGSFEVAADALTFDVGRPSRHIRAVRKLVRHASSSVPIAPVTTSLLRSQRPCDRAHPEKIHPDSFSISGPRCSNMPDSLIMNYAV